MKTIMVVEDDKILVEALKAKLEHNDFKIVVASNGEEALQLVKNSKPDLILLDLLMPKMDGQTFYYHLKETVDKDIPVIVLTNMITSAIPDGVVATLIKSDTSLDEIVNKIQLNLKV